jgi:microcystin-dependent protein
MSYTINLTNGSVYATLQDGTVNTSTGLTLIGRNYTNYGDAQNENFVKLLENFADTIPPTQSTSALLPLIGTLWYDTGNNLLKVYDGTNFNPVSQRILSATAPTAKNVGDQWWDLTNQQLKVWTGTQWVLIGPLYSSSQGLSGPAVASITDTQTYAHTIVENYVGANLVSVISADPTFTPAISLTGFTNLQPGINLASGTVLNGTATNSNAIGGVAAANIARTDILTTFTDLGASGNLVLTNANIFYSSGSLNIRNTAYQGGLNVYLNTSIGGNVSVLSVDGTTGLISVYSDPQSSKHVATKNYVDTQVAILGASSSNVQITGGNILNANLVNVTEYNSTLTNCQANTPVFDDYTTNIATTQFVHNILPRGVILMWSGAVGLIPSGWHLCDGTNGTPDLRGMFVIGAGGSYAVGDTGGSNSVTLSASNIPSHSHTLSTSGTTATGGAHTHTASSQVVDPGHHHSYNTLITTYPQSGSDTQCWSGITTGQTGTSTTGITVSTSVTANVGHQHTFSLSGSTDPYGSGSPVTVTPPYYALCYIMKMYGNGIHP